MSKKVNWTGDILELLKFEIMHDEIILMWEIMDKEQNLTVEYFKD